MQEPTGHAHSLEDIERLQRLANNHAEIEIIAHDKLRGTEVGGVEQRVPFLVVGAVVPDGAVVVALDEPDLVGGVGADVGHLAVVADERFEFPAERVALDPVHYIATEGGASSNGACRVDVEHVVAHVFEDLDEVGVRGAAPVVLDLEIVLGG